MKKIIISIDGVKYMLADGSPVGEACEKCDLRSSCFKLGSVRLCDFLSFALEGNHNKMQCYFVELKDVKN